MLKNKAAIPIFTSKAAEIRSVYEDPIEIVNSKASSYQNYKSRSQNIRDEHYRKIKEKQEKAEIALKQWRKLKFEKFNRNHSNQSNENNERYWINFKCLD